MFVCPRYNTGCTPRAAPAANTASAGDGFCFPDANQFVSSAIQKSGSLCAAIASCNVNIIPDSIVYSMPLADKYSATGLKSSVTSPGNCVGAGAGLFSIGACASVSASVVPVSLSKFTSENTGANVGVPISNGLSSATSKSVGKGSSVAGCSSGCGAGVAVWDDVILLISKFDFGAWPLCARARINAARSSVGISFGAGVGVVSTIGAVSAVWGSVSWVGLIVSSGTGCINCGNGIVNNGFLVRKMILVVAMYIGIAAKISIPKTKPGKPRSCACIKICHCAPENMSKLNRHFKTAHIITP